MIEGWVAEWSEIYNVDSFKLIMVLVAVYVDSVGGDEDARGCCRHYIGGSGCRSGYRYEGELVTRWKL